MLLKKLSPVVVAVLIALSLPVQAAGKGRAPAPQSALSSLESQDLAFMREEEKVARDIYLALYEKWGLTPFANISGSEQRHMDALLNLLTKYRLPDPAAGLTVGAFINPELQALHDGLLAKGLASNAEALKVGGAIEETDILDLRDAMNHADHTDLDAVYDQLQCGSRNHLRAFARFFQALTGQAYPATVMDRDEVAAILAVPHERCGR